jgi:AcrR family transcriptional regulator
MVQKERRPRGRPRTFEPEAVLDEARSVFWNRGFAATSLDDLAAATGLNRPSLYGAFGDKHALYLAALERTRTQGVEALRQALQSPRPLQEVLTAVFQGAIRVYRVGEAGPRGCFVIGTAVTQGVEDAQARAVLARFVAETDAAFAERLTLAEKDGELREGMDPVGVAAIASATLHTLAIRARAGASENELRGVAQAAVNLICREKGEHPTRPGHEAGGGAGRASRVRQPKSGR